MTPRTHRNHRNNRTVYRIRSQFEELLRLTEHTKTRVERVSGWSVGEHIDHLIKADRSIFGRFDDPMDGPLPPLSGAGRLVLWTGWIPRGKGSAPKASLPEAPGTSELAAGLTVVQGVFEESLEPAERLTDPRPVARHHIFGGLSMAQWLRFIGVHHHHHAKIMRDILRADPA